MSSGSFIILLIETSENFCTIQLEFFNSIFLTFGAAGLYLVTKGKIFLSVFRLLLQNRTSVVKVHIRQGSL